MTTIKWETAENMMNIVAFVAMETCIERGEQINIETIQEFARNMFQEYCDAVGITEVEDPEEENSEDFEDAEDDSDSNDEDEDEDEELPSDEEVMNLIMQVLYGQ